MTELTDDLKKLLNNFQQIYSKYNENERVNKEISSIVCNLRQENEILKQNEQKSAEQMNLLRQICNEQLKTISELHEFEKQNELLTEENLNLKSLIQNLNNKIYGLEINNNEIIQGFISKHKLEIETMEQLFTKRENELQEKIEGLQASFDLQMFEKETDKNNFKIKYEEKLKEAASKETNLKQELFKVNNQLSSNTAVLQKKILELEQKLKTYEREKSMFNISKGNFISANNILRNYSSTSTNITNDQQPTQKSSIMRNVAQNIESNTTKKFQFRKSHNPSKQKTLLSESFDPFEMNKQIIAEKQNANNTQPDNPIISYEIIEDNNSDNSNNSQNKSEEIRIVQNSEEIIQKTKIVKKRKLFNPKNTDYLN